MQCPIPTAVLLFGFFLPLFVAVPTSVTSADQPPNAATDSTSDPSVPDEGDWVLAIHGGAGGESKGLTPLREAAYHAALQRALTAGAIVLSEDGTALDAVESAVRVLENEPLFNAGRGAVMTIDGTFELDASIMDGRDLKVGGVAGITVASNPISVARAVMEATPHVLLGGTAADRFAAAQGFAVVSADYFFEARRFQEIQKRRAARGLEPLPDPSRRLSEGTVGAVARDRSGNLAAATSTGGRSGKLSGRIGDSPIAGAGTYAANGVAAISGTGIGEEFIRHSAAARVAWLIQDAGMSTDEATRKVIDETLQPGDGGMIVLGPDGPPVIRFSTAAMSRGWIDASGHLETRIGRDRAKPASPQQE